MNVNLRDLVYFQRDLCQVCFSYKLSYKTAKVYNIKYVKSYYVRSQDLTFYLTHGDHDFWQIHLRPLKTYVRPYNCDEPIFHSKMGQNSKALRSGALHLTFINRLFRSNRLNRFNFWLNSI